MLATRQFGSCFIVMLMAGAILLATTQFLPLLVQQNFGYTATWAGLVLSPGGVVTMMMMFANGRLLTFVQPKYLIATGALIVAASMYGLTNIYGDLDFSYFAWSRIYIGAGLPLIFVPVLTASYAGVPPDKTDQASALMNAARNIGGSIGVSLGVNVLAFRGQFHQSRLVESVYPLKPGVPGHPPESDRLFRPSRAVRYCKPSSRLSRGSASRCKSERLSWPISMSFGP